eukprot:CAMPEP_0195323414 /NCGR_PEP_ID=MMETSP0708-20121125/7918_1 /TAXON_ID=33640 /ORGANISM="Asterionellopsis glacialis, Strain CCMP134" /LENGTH=32 /DNA_ID= /DNA_START= /DNA_END= /DNA_ORIENTATION=
MNFASSGNQGGFRALAYRNSNADCQDPRHHRR